MIQNANFHSANYVNCSDATDRQPAGLFDKDLVELYKPTWKNSSYYVVINYSVKELCQILETHFETWIFLMLHSISMNFMQLFTLDEPFSLASGAAELNEEYIYRISLLSYKYNESWFIVKYTYAH